MQVDILHWHDLRVASARSPALHAEHRPERGLAQTDDRLLADVIERIPEADGHGRLALSRGCRGNRSNEDQAPVGAVFETCQILKRDLRLVTAKCFQVVFGDTQALNGN